MKIGKRYYSYMHKSRLEEYVRDKALEKDMKGMRILPCIQ